MKESATESSRDRAVKLFNDLQEIDFTQIAIILSVCWAVVFATQKLLPFLAKCGPSQLRLYLLNMVPIIRLVMLTIAILWVFPLIFNVTFENFLVIAGGASVAIGFAFKDYVSSIIAGIVATFERPYRPGDWVRIAGDYGEVKSVGMRAISLVTATDDIITVPHQRIWSENICNSNDGERTLMCVADFYLTPDHDPHLVRDLLRDVAMTSAYLEYGKPVLVILKNEVWGVHYQVKAYPFDLRDQFAFISDLTARGKDALRRREIREAAFAWIDHPPGRSGYPDEADEPLR